MTAVSSVTVQNEGGIQDVHPLPADVVVGQVRAVYDDVRPLAVKVGLVNDAEAIRLVRDEIVGCSNVVCSPGIVSSHGGSLMSHDALHALTLYLLPITRLLVLKCADAEIILGRPITTDDDMLQAAAALRDMGAEWVLLRGGVYAAGRINALLYGSTAQFFSSYNIEGWQKHGVGAALSTAIATRLAQGDDVPSAVRNAHTYMHNRVVYAVEAEATARPVDLYNQFLSLITDHYHEAHDVSFYAENLSITPRYLSHITRTVVAKSPKQVIDDYLLHEVELLLTTTTLTIQEISHILGFSSQAVLAKFFHQHRGVSPTIFRRR